MSKIELTDRDLSQEIISINGYEVIERIGVGSYGRVYKVSKNKKYYVLKEIPLNLSSAADKINSVQNEADILSSLDNKYVVKFYKSFKKNQNIYKILMGISRYLSLSDNIISLSLNSILIRGKLITEDAFKNNDDVKNFANFLNQILQ